MDKLSKIKEKISLYFYIGQQLGMTDASTTAFTAKDKDGKPWVLLFKTSDDKLDTPESYWKRQQQAEEQKVFFTTGYIGDVFIPQATIMDGYRIMPYAGENLTQQLYQKHLHPKKSSLCTWMPTKLE